MSSNLNEKNIADYLFEDIPSDDNSITDIDDFDDQDYLPPQQKPIEVVESSSSDENVDDNEFVEIMCLNEGNILTLPSPKKFRNTQKNLNVCPASTSKIHPVNKNKRKKTISRALFDQLPTNENNSSQNDVPIVDENIAQIVQFEFIPPNWSKNYTSLWPTIPEFTSLVGPSDSIDKLQCHTPFSIFNLLFSDEIMNMLVEQTNLYAFQRSQKTAKPYIQTNIQELKTFFGINLLMGIKRSPSYRDYWSSSPDLHDQYISSLMTVNRFGWLLSSLHINNNVLMPKRGETGYDKLYKIRPFLTMIKQNFQTYYNPERVVAVDESMIKFKGRSTIKQYMPKKPIKRGYKVWSLVDKKGYLWNFDMYVGKVGDTVQKDLGGSVVKNLSLPIQNKNHCLYMDNYFTSVPLLNYLKIKGIHACGTVNSSRKHLPKMKPDSALKIGDYDWEISDKNCVSIVKWKDKRIVNLLSNFHDPKNVTQVKRRAKDGTQSMVPCPLVLHDYNNNMNCVDKFDQNKKSYQIDRKSQKWWHRIFFFFFDSAIVNSRILYNEITKESMSMKDFRRQVSRELVAKTLVEKRRSSSDSPITPKNLKKGSPSVPKEVRIEQSAHQPKRSTRRRCNNCSSKAKEVRTDWVCSICEVPLCLGKSRNCFAEYHKT